MTRVRTVTGEISSADLGITLCHEHLLNDGSAAWRKPAGDAADDLWVIAREPLRTEFVGRLRDNPYLSLDNTRLDSVDDAITEAGYFASAGGKTIVDVTLEGIGRDPHGLVKIAQSTGLNVIMGTGYYFERAHPAELASMTIDQIADAIVQDITTGVDGIHAGIIGEIGVGPNFTAAEERVLRAASRAQAATGVPLSVHLPAWERVGHRVLDIVAEEGANLCATILSHMNPSWMDGSYQRTLADRGAWLEYDMLGMDYFYPGEGQSPSEEENAAAVVALIADGYAGSLLFSHDVFIKMLLRRYGGYGYSYVLTSFVPRLERHGVATQVALGILTDNPRAVFESAAKGERK
ncbi:MAG: phosphotriesterase [Coriobacteriia bacterium]|nr:phosphotriesterase [Coriobacteriia bacterium]MBN2823140.1 phosphotriesterase [Coriobacteriia bacterium]